MNVPAKLKSADITRFAQRAAQVESLKPPVAYWCYYWIVQQILSNGLHNADDETKAFTTSIMDKLEEMKIEHATDEAITDDMAGQAYVEQFGFQTFQRADNAILANKATRQTADTFQASATFLELVNIWGAPSPEIASKVKYAKFHALRIAKAIRSGEDPNLSNPVPEPEPAGDTVALDPNDPEVRQINGADDQPSIAEEPVQHDEAQVSVLDSSLTREHQQPHVTDMSEEQENTQHSLKNQSALGGSQDLTRNPSIPRAPVVELPLDSNNSNAARLTPPSTDAFESAHTSPPQSARPHSGVRQASIGGGYFPGVTLPDTPADPQHAAVAPSGATSPSGYVQPTITSVEPENPQAFYGSPQSSYPTAQVPQPSSTPQQQQSRAAVQQAQAAPQTYHQQPYQPPIQQNTFSPPSNAPQTYLDDDAAVLAAQKHAKFAISALNFEDVPTAVKELREALKSLGAS